MEVQLIDGQQHADAHGQSHYDAHQYHALQGALFDTVIPPRAQILGCEAGHGCAQRVHGRHHQTVELVGRAKAVLGGVGHHAAIQHIELHHAALHDDDAHRQHGKLESQRDAAAHVAAHIVHGDVPVFLLQPDVGIVGKGVAEAAHGADELGGHGGRGGPCHAPVELQDKQQVQPHVQHRGEQQEYQRRHRVAHAPQERADKVVEHLSADAHEDDETVGIGGVIDLGVRRRHVDPRQHGVQQRQSQRRQHHRQYRRQHDLGGQTAADAPVVLRPHVAGCHHTEARADAEGKLQKDEHQ